MTDWCIAVAQYSPESKTVDPVDGSVETFYNCALYPSFELAHFALLMILVGHSKSIDEVGAPDDVVAEHAQLTVDFLDVTEEDFADRKSMSVTSSNLFAYGISKGDMPESFGGRHFTLVADHRECTDEHCNGDISAKN